MSNGMTPAAMAEGIGVHSRRLEQTPALAPALGHPWRQDRWEDILAQKGFLVLLCCLLFSSMPVPQALQNVSNLARGNRIGSSLPLFITVNREKVFNVEKNPFPLACEPSPDLHWECWQ